MTGKVVSTPFDAITYQLTGCAMAVYRELEPGLRENSHLAQIIGYLAVSTCPVGLLINFGERSLRHRRVFPPQKVTDDLINRQWLFVPDWLRSGEDHR